MRTACSDLPQNFVNSMNPRVLRRRSASCPTDRADTALPTAIWRCGFWVIRKSATTSARGKSGEIGWICRSKYRKRKRGNDWKIGSVEDWEKPGGKRAFHPSLLPSPLPFAVSRCKSHLPSESLSLLLYANACSRSAIISSTSSNPTETLTKPSVIPARRRASGETCECVVEAG